VLPPLDTPGCAGRRNCNVNLDDRAGIVQTKIANPSKRGTSRAIFKWTRHRRRAGAVGETGVLAGAGGSGGKSWGLGAA